MSGKSKIFIAALILIIIVFAALSVLVSMFGKGMVEKQVEKGLGMETKIEGISLRLPFTIYVKGLEIGDIFKARSIYFRPSLLGALSGRIVLNGLTLVNPVFNLELYPDGKLNLTQSGEKKAPQEEGRQQAKDKQKKKAAFFLTGLTIKNGRFVFTDRQIMRQGYKTIVDEININISKTIFPLTSLNTKFKFEGNVVDGSNRHLGGIYGSGWVDFGPKDMDGTLEIKELELAYFTPYYGSFLSSRKLLSVKLTTLSEFRAKNNDLSVATQLKLHDLVYADEAFKAESPTSVFELVQKTLDVFLDSSGDLDLQFTVNTKLDKPRVTIEELKGVVLEAAIKNLSNRSPAELIKKGKDLIEQFKDFGEGMEDLF